jgi:electron transport complex protein RnfE
MAEAAGASRFGAELVKGLWRENPVLVAALGLCPAMAVTNSLRNGLVMGVATGVVLVGSSLLVSALRRAIPREVRITVYITIIATYVTAVDLTLAAFLPDAHKQLGAFIALIVVNCIILGRQEAFAAKNPVGLSVADALGMSGGMTLALVLIAGVRELLGSGTLLGYRVLGDWFEPWVIMVLPPGGFLTMGALLMLVAWVRLRKSARPETGAIPGDVA